MTIAVVARNYSQRPQTFHAFCSRLQKQPEQILLSDCMCHELKRALQHLHQRAILRLYLPAFLGPYHSPF